LENLVKDPFLKFYVSLVIFAPSAILGLLLTVIAVLAASAGVWLIENSGPYGDSS
jgi:hypothetical protein